MKIITLMALIVLAGCTTHPAVLLDGKATGEASTFSVGTLCSVGSFECEVSPSYSQIASVVHRATFDYRQGRISADTLQGIVNRGRAAVAALDAALTICNQNSRTGRCNGNEAAARAQLLDAKRAVAVLR